MTATLQAFSMEHYGEQLLHIAELWDIVNVATASPNNQYERFKEHYNQRLADLYNHNCNAPTAVTNQAHSVVDTPAKQNDCLFNLESDWHNTAYVSETFPPSQAPANNHALSVTDMLLKQLIQQVATMAVR